MKRNKNRNKFTKKRGFTMIEIVIASSILALIFGGMTVFGINVVKGNKRNQAVKNVVENVSYAMEFINKSVRTSHFVSSQDGSELFIVDNKTGSSYCYEFDNFSLQRKIGDGTESNCSEITESPIVIAGNDKIKVEGEFYLKETDLTSDERGFVRTKVVLSHAVDEIDFADNEDQMVIQSSVSLRDYGYLP